MFKLFDKKTHHATPPSPAMDEDDTSKMLPATPKMKFGGFLSKSPNTPTLTDGSLRGEQKRTRVLEQQLKDVSLTASKAYDKIEEFQMQNALLEDQVNQQKELILSFTKQLEEVNNEKRNFKHLQERDMLEKLKERSEGSEELNRLKQQNDLLYQENVNLREQIQKLRKEKEDGKVLLENAEKKYKLQLDKKIEEGRQLQLRLQESTSTSLKDVARKQHSERAESIDDPALMKSKVTELEHLLERKTHAYEQTILGLKKSMLVLTDNKTFLNKTGYATTESLRFYSTEENDEPDMGGDTFILSNISFVR